MVKTTDRKPKYYLNEKGEFVIENYNFSKPFSSFLPGIAGRYGIPMWTFYANRGQCISSFGIKDKDHAILEFLSANKAWQLVSTHGFRTFIKITSGKNTLFYEPFHNGFTNLGYKITNKMLISPAELTLEEENISLGLKVTIKYFNIPNDNYAGLARIITIKNLKPATRKIQLLDGLPQIVPFGTSNFFLKKMSRTIEAWMNVENLEKSVPFYKLVVDPIDRPEVIHIQEGNFYLGFSYKEGKLKIIKPIIDPETIFGSVTDFSCPRSFLNDKFSVPKNENVRGKTPSAFLPSDFKLKRNAEKTIYSVSGYMRNLKELNSAIPKITKSGYLESKMLENREVINALLEDAATKSSSREFDLYTQQTYLDNLMRGGYPFIFPRPSFNTSGGIPLEAEKSEVIFYLYSRKHGDPERDYNKFQIAPTYFSQGNGNYRDLNQNRRNDIWFNPKIKDENIINLFNLIQTDGFNPLVVKGCNFILDNPKALKAKLKGICEEKQIPAILRFANKPFTPGEIILFLEDKKIKINKGYDEFLGIVLSLCLKTQEAEHGEGFWTDHWHYNLDLLESYLGVYPEKLKEIIFIKKVFTFFDNVEVVKPRSEKYVIYDRKVKQLHSIGTDKQKKEMVKKRGIHPYLVRSEYGQGEIYQTTMINKLLCILSNTLASLDPFGIGIEMEANKPNWFDALNGLPALSGSSLCETFELKRLALLIKKAVEKCDIDKIAVTEEIYDFLFKLNKLNNQGQEYWEDSHSLKEDYRQKTKLGLSGNEKELYRGELLSILNKALGRIKSGIKKALDKKNNTYYSYFINEVLSYERLKDNFVRPIKFKQIPLPLFLEGQMHALRLAGNQEQAKALHRGTKKSALFDKKLKMYKVTAPLNSMPEEIGRCRIFTPGWLENESIWLHMEYKYLLELLKSGLYEEFYADFKNVLIPFQKPAQYGRSILENSSFLVSSASPDKKLHGNGFVARLSGSTAEFLEIWLKMNLGIKPFFLNSLGELNCRFSPILKGWLFDKNGCYSFNFLSRIKITYHNPKRKNTFGASTTLSANGEQSRTIGRNAVKITKIIFNDKNDSNVEIASKTIPHPYALQIRQQLIHKIDIYFG